MSFPHGECECRQGCQCERYAGPAAFEITREDGSVTMKVCTKCDLSTDRTKRLLVTSADDLGPYEDYDFLGAFCIAARLAEDESAAAVRS